jgi:hypothetical protein
MATLMLYSIRGYPSASVSWGFWHLRDISGEVDLLGQYRQLVSRFNDVTEDQRSSYLMGGIKLNTSSYLWEEDILLIDLNVAYSPEAREEQYITIPDRSEVRTLKKVGLTTTLFNNKPLTLQGFFNFDQHYYNRELLTNVRSNNLHAGGIISSNNRVLPVTITYRSTNWDQEETETGRTFRTNQQHVQARTSKSFGTRDRSELEYTHNNYHYWYTTQHQTHHLIDRVALNNHVYLDSARRYQLNSRITWHNQEGTNSFRRLEVVEGISLHLPYQLRFRANFDLYNLKDPLQVWDQKRGRVSLEHKLFESLLSRVRVEMSRSGQEAVTLHEEQDLRAGAELRYTKKIPTGFLNLSYRYYRHRHTTEGVTGSLQVYDESHTLSDGEMTTLDHPYIEVLSVMVKDVTGTITYQLNFDYILIDRGGYLEIQRVPGGLIPNNATILVDYTYRQPGSYSYGANNNYFNASILLFQHLLELYYRYSVQDYPRVEQADLLTLNYYNQHLLGIRVDVGFARAGIEIDRYESNIVPYRMRRYYMDLNWNYKAKLLMTLNGNIRDYRMIAGEEDQLYANVSGKVVYKIRPRISVSLESGYLNQRGTNIDLDLITARAEFHSVFNKLHLRIGMDMYRRVYLESGFAFNGGYIQLTRKF